MEVSKERLLEIEEMNDNKWLLNRAKKRYVFSLQKCILCDKSYTKEIMWRIKWKRFWDLSLPARDYYSGHNHYKRFVCVNCGGNQIKAETVLKAIKRVPIDEKERAYCW